MNKQWPKVELGGVLKYVARPINVQADEIYREIGIRSHGKGVFHKQPISGLELGNKKVFWVEPGDFVLNIVFAWEGAVCVLGAAERGMIGSHRFPTFRADESRLDIRFLLAFFKTPNGVEMLGRISPGGAGRNRTLSKTAFLKLEIPLPPLAEQRRVVARIEELAAQIHEARTLRHQANAEAEVLLGNFLAAAFERYSSKFSMVQKLGKLTQVRGGGTPSKHNPAFWDGNIPWVSPKDMKVADIIDAQDHITEDAVRESATSLIPKNSVLVVVRSGILKRTLPVAINRVPVATNQDMKSLVPSEALSPEFLRWWFKGNERKLLQSVKGGTTVQSLVWHEVINMDVPVPPLPEQRRIVAELDALQAEADTLKRLQVETNVELDEIGRAHV